MKRFQQGYTLIEWMVVIAIGLFLTAGLSSIFVASKGSTVSTQQVGELQEKGRFALQIITQDLKHVGFWGEFTGNALEVGNGISIPTNLTSDCLDSEGHGSFPDATQKFRDLWAFEIPATGSVPMTCADDKASTTTLVRNTDALSIKRVRGLPVTSALDANSYYLISNVSQGSIFAGNIETLPTMSNSQIWQLVHHVYYLDREVATDIPRLRRIRLTRDKGMLLETTPLIEGVENMQLLFGLDIGDEVARDGTADTFVPSDQLTNADWDNGRVVGVKLFLLLRAIEETPGYKNNQTYQVGEKTIKGNGDRFRRLLLSTVVSFRNTILVNSG